MNFSHPATPTPRIFQLSSFGSPHQLHKTHMCKVNKSRSEQTVYYWRPPDHREKTNRSLPDLESNIFLLRLVGSSRNAFEGYPGHHLPGAGYCVFTGRQPRSSNTITSKPYGNHVHFIFHCDLSEYLNSILGRNTLPI